MLSLTYFFLFAEDFTEELLALHDAEIQQLKQHYDEHRELFDGVQQWEESWRLLLELEVSQPCKIFWKSNISCNQSSWLSVFTLQNVYSFYSF